MSAAVPLPPPGPTPPHNMDGYTNGHHNNAPTAWSAGNAPSDPSGMGGPFPPISDIAASATDKAESLKLHSIKKLLDLARHHTTNAQSMLANRHSKAGAYWEFLVAYEITINLIPRHRDYIDQIENSRSQVYRDFRTLLRDVKSEEERFVRIRDIIKNDNLRNGGQHTKSSSTVSTARPTSRNGTHIPQRHDELMLPDAPVTLPSRSSDSPRKKPVIQPKPQSLHGRAVHQSSQSLGGTSDLAARFANLRIPNTPLDTSSTASTNDLSVKMPSPADYQSSNRPLGPRSMPASSLGNPQLPPKLPLDTQLATSLPKEPSPTYSPARNTSHPASINPPRSTPRSMNGTGGRSNSIASSASSLPPNKNGVTGSYFPAQHGSRDPPTRSASLSKSTELEIDAEKLYDYIRMFNVLIIDVRSREEFDAGHVFVKNIICIEPDSLSDGNSAEQLLDRLVISPDEEVHCYERRSEYDVVVYYDNSTRTIDFLDKHNHSDSELALKRLFDTLHEFNQDKPLKRPPVFLRGGLDAWIDIVGPQALKLSTTSALGPGGQPRSRALRRSPAASHVTARAQVQKRRRREYVPMDEEEQQKWLEEARKGRAIVEPSSPDDGQDAPESPFYRTTEDFLRRFPEIEAEQSMMYPLSRPSSNNQYVAPAIPPAPSRPAPSVPRVSYSGVHERQVAPQGRANHPPVYLSQPRFTTVRMHRTGLINFGVTCYQNAVVQCLSGHLLLSDLFLTQRYQRELQRDNWKGTKGILPEAYATLLSNLFKGDVNSVRPTTFRRICGKFNKVWTIDEQQDAKEFLEFVLDLLHEDLNVTWNKPPLHALTEQAELQREKLPRQYAAKIEWARYQHRDMSIIGGMFAGQHASQLTCQTCGITSTTYEAFWSLSLEIPHEQACDVRDCLRSYCSAERLAGDELWRCPRCKKDREAVKRIIITRAPDTLVIHFKRFSASRTQSARKIRTPIQFPLQSLDMSPFIEPCMTPEQEKQIIHGAREGAAQLAGVKSDPTMNGPFIYNAYAVIWHQGTSLGSGHYTAFVKDKAQSSWRYFNDDKVTDFEPANMAPENRLQNGNAYIVFYERERVAGGAF